MNIQMRIVWVSMTALTLATGENMKPIAISLRDLQLHYNITSQSQEHVPCDSSDHVQFRACGFTKKDLERVKCCMVFLNSSQGIKELPTWRVADEDGGGCLQHDTQLNIAEKVEVYCAYECNKNTRIGAPSVPYDGVGPCQIAHQVGTTQRVGVTSKNSTDSFAGILSIVNHEILNYSRAVLMSIIVTATCDFAIKDCNDVQFCAAPVLDPYHAGGSFIVSGSSSPDKHSVALDYTSQSPQFVHYGQFLLWPVDKHVYQNCSLASLQMAAARNLLVSLHFSPDEIPPTSTAVSTQSIAVQKSASEIPGYNVTESTNPVSTKPWSTAAIVIGSVAFTLIGCAAFIFIIAFFALRRYRNSRKIYVSQAPQLDSVLPSDSDTRTPSEDHNVGCPLLTESKSETSKSDLPSAQAALQVQSQSGC